MLVCPRMVRMVDCFVIMSMCDLALCNECSLSESRGEIPIKGGSLSHPKIPIMGCDLENTK
jgi:hypothetical protein